MEKHDDLRLGPARRPSTGAGVPPAGTGLPPTGTGIVCGSGCPPVLIHPGASAPSRRWPVRRWAAVAVALLRRGATVTVTGSPAERPLVRRMLGYAVHSATGAGDRALIRSGIRDLSGRTDLDDLMELVGTAAAVLSPDTGVAHMATACATPSVVLFGPVSPARWGPLIDTDLHRVLRADGRRGAQGVLRPAHPSNAGRTPRIWSDSRCCPDPRLWTDPRLRTDPRLAAISVGAVLRAVASLPVPLGQPKPASRIQV